MLKIQRKPPWLNKKINLSACRKLKSLLRDLRLHSVCEESSCPNISECFCNVVATFMILGDTCTRACAFCGVNKGKPAPVDSDQPRRIKEAVRRLGLRYVVITSPTRDDLSDAGAELFYRTAEAVKSIDYRIRVEILIPDFKGRRDLIKQVVNSRAEVIAHNLETTSSLYSKVRKNADYSRSLEVLRLIKEINKNTFTKSSLILGLGEKEEEIIQTLVDLRQAGCDFLTLGQYLPPSLNHYSLKEYIHPDKFTFLEQYAGKLGFQGVKSTPYARSSYLAHTFF